MASGATTPLLILTGVSFANNWYNTGKPDLKIPLGGAFAAGILALFSNVNGFSPVAERIGWLALVALLIAPIQKPSPADNILKIVGAK